MIANRSVPSAPVIPVLAYTDVVEAADWLCNSFGFSVRLRIADHRAQLVYGEGAVIVTDGGRDSGAAGTHSVLVRVDDADSHHVQAIRHGARILNPPTDYPLRGEAVHRGGSGRPPLDVLAVDRGCRPRLVGRRSRRRRLRGGPMSRSTGTPH